MRVRRRRRFWGLTRRPGDRFGRGTRSVSAPAGRHSKSTRKRGAFRSSEGFHKMVTPAGAGAWTIVASRTASRVVAPCHVGMAPRVGRNRKVAILSTESIAGVSPTLQGTGEQCASCGAPMAADQRYCLECGERRRDGQRLPAGPARRARRRPPPRRACRRRAPPPTERGPRSSTLSLIAGVGVLLLAMGVGVLIGRSGGSARQSAAPAAGRSPSASTPPAAGERRAAEANPSPTTGRREPTGYTVQLQTLPTDRHDGRGGRSRRRAARARKGASAVGALKSEDFASLPAGSYVIYSGVYHKHGEAEKALAGPPEEVPRREGDRGLRTGSGSSAAGSGGSNSSGGGAGATPKHPAPPGVLEGLSHAKGKSYEEKSKNLPDVVSTG